MTIVSDSVFCHKPSHWCSSAIISECNVNLHFQVTDATVWCQDWLKDVLRHGVAFATDAVHRRHHTGCVDCR